MTAVPVATSSSVRLDRRDTRPGHTAHTPHSGYPSPASTDGSTVTPSALGSSCPAPWLQCWTASPRFDPWPRSE